MSDTDMDDLTDSEASVEDASSIGSAVETRTRTSWLNARIPRGTLPSSFIEITTFGRKGQGPQSPWSSGRFLRELGEAGVRHCAREIGIGSPT